MLDLHQISRREFLRMATVASSAVILGACSSKNIIETAIPLLPTLIPTIKPIKAISPTMVVVEAGSFQMGSMDGYPDEQPVHPVNITKSFYIGKFAVTFDEYDLFCEDIGFPKPDDSEWGRGKLPVIQVDFYDATAYCNWLSTRENLELCYGGKGKGIQCDFSANGYRLPTEAEWEYAARGGQNSLGYTFAGSNHPEEVSWYDEISNGKIHPVGQKKPNELGLYDMSGNLYEWCWDWYSEDYYASSQSDDPKGPPPPQATTSWDLIRVRRSGSWREKSESSRITFRSFDAASHPGDNGFRLVRNA